MSPLPAVPASLLLLALGCAGATAPSVPSPGTASGGAADTVYRLLEGRFDSADQARSSPGYESLQIVACPADAPSLGPRVLYVEQARTGAPGSPARQRVLVIEPGEPLESAAVSRVFELAVPGSSIGACGLPVRPRFSREELVERVGCTVALHADGKVWRGATSGRGCPSTREGATYSTTEWVLDAFGFRSWERAFDAHGAQRGGPPGPTVFVRRTPLPPP